jgi:hypothetical protein
MSHCPDREERLNDYLDDLLSAVPREEMDRHLAECRGCREGLAALRSLRERAAELPRGREPERDLWPAIRASLPERESPRAGLLAGWRGSLVGAPAGRPAFIPGRFVATAAAILVIVAVGIVTLRRGASSTPSPAAGLSSSDRPADSGLADPSPAANPSDGGAAPAVHGAPMPAAPPTGGGVLAGLEDREFLRAEEEYLRATAQLRAALEQQRGRAPAGALEVIDVNLRIVEQTIREVRAAAEREPGRRVDGQLYANLYRTQFDLLRQAVRLSSGDPEEPPS